MERVAYSESLHWSVWEDAAARLEQADRYCSSPFWGLALAGSFFGNPSLYIYREGESLAIFQEHDVEGGRLVLPCDVMWMLGSPLLSPDPAGFLLRLCDFWRKDRSRLRQVTVGGLYSTNPVWSSPAWLKYSHWSLHAAGRMVASLDGGCDGFLSRRSVNFRSRLRRAVKKSESEGVSVEFWPHRPDHGAALALLDRAMKVEAQSWKGQAGQGVDRGQMNGFYRRMLPLLAQHGRLRGLYLSRDGEDLAYLFGAAFAGYFRGLQFSYKETEAASLGNVAQWRMIGHMADEDCHSYDLGQAMEYKTRWAENHIPSRAMALQIDRA